jgi:hypothetical protein
LTYDPRGSLLRHQLGEMPIERVFDDGYDYFLSARELAKGYQTYVDRLNIVSIVDCPLRCGADQGQNVALSTSLENATYRPEQDNWTLRLNHAGQTRTWVTKHVVLAIGAGSGQIPKMPDLPGRVSRCLRHDAQEGRYANQRHHIGQVSRNGLAFEILQELQWVERSSRRRNWCC